LPPHPSWMYMSAKPEDIPVGSEGQASGWSTSFTVPLAVLVVSGRRTGDSARGARYHHTVVPLSVAESDGATVVLARVAGHFPGSPVELQHTFRLDGGQIASLEIR